jgi:hypothetical protein
MAAEAVVVQNGVMSSITGGRSNELCQEEPTAEKVW